MAISIFRKASKRCTWRWICFSDSFTIRYVADKTFQYFHFPIGQEYSPAPVRTHFSPAADERIR